MSKWDELTAEEKNQLVHERVMERHSEYLFCYSQNMAAAWLVMQHIHKTWDQPSKNTWYAPKRKQFLYELQRLGNIANKPGLYIAWPDFVFSLDPELICRAALTVMGAITMDGEIVEEVQA